MSAPEQIPLRLVRPPRARGSPLRRRQGQLRRRYRAAGRQARRAGDVPASGRAHRLDRQVARRWRCPACTTCSTAQELARRDRVAGRRPRYAERAALSAGASTSRATPANGSRRWWPTARARRGRRRSWSTVEYEPLPFVLDAEEAYAGGTLVHEAHGSNVLLDRTFVWGEVEKDFAASPHTVQASREMGPQLDRADRDLRRDGKLGPVARDPRRLGLDPDAEISRPDSRWR